jgi:hypothetical protein
VARVAKVISYTRDTDERGNVAEVKCDLGGNTVTAEHYAPPGDDAYPLPGDFVLLVPGDGTGNWLAQGFMDPQLAGEAAAGERIIYSRSAPGVMAAKLHLKADGTVEISNAAGLKVTIAAGAIEADAEITAKNLVPAAKVTVSQHMIPSPFGPLGPPVPGQ